MRRCTLMMQTRTIGRHTLTSSLSALVEPALLRRLRGWIKALRLSHWTLPTVVGSSAANGGMYYAGAGTSIQREAGISDDPAPFLGFTPPDAPPRAFAPTFMSAARHM